MDMMKRATGARPKIWGRNMIGFGSFTTNTTAGAKATCSYSRHAAIT
jgi:hypothetical protein